MARSFALATLSCCLFLQTPRWVHGGEEVGRGAVYAVAEIVFEGPRQSSADCPARDVELSAVFRHESGSPEYRLWGFWDGDGQGSASGNVFKIRFCPTAAGRWTLAKVESNVAALARQHEGDYFVAQTSRYHGFWLADARSAGHRWFCRSDGSHQYILGNTHYSFLSGHYLEGKPTGNDIAGDIAANAQYFKKLRFAVHGDRYPHPTEKPFLDDRGQPSEQGDYSHRPNPAWFSGRVDLAVRTAFEHDLIADLILAGPDVEESRSTLRAAKNDGDAEPYLRYIAARYGSYPNVWLCLSNEYNIRVPRWQPADMARFGRIVRDYLAYPTPLSVHPNSPDLWRAQFDSLPGWHSHHIFQRKIRTLDVSADVMASIWKTPAGKPRLRPTVNDELSYQGAGDRHSELDTVEAHLGAFLGGGYGSTGYKSGDKTGQYFAGKFLLQEHTAADNLGFLRQVIDRDVRFWRLAPGAAIFENSDDRFRAMSAEGEEYVLGTNAARRGIVAQLPPGRWKICEHDIVAMTSRTLVDKASGPFKFDSPDSRAVLFHFRRVGD